jgi:hypothetical protein
LECGKRERYVPRLVLRDVFTTTHARRQSLPCLSFFREGFSDAAAMTVGFARKQRDGIQASVKTGSKNYTDAIQKIEGTVRSVVALMLSDSSVNSNLMEHLLLADPPETPSADVPELPEAVVVRQAQFDALAQSIKDLTTTVTGGFTASKDMETLKAISLGEERSVHDPPWIQPELLIPLKKTTLNPKTVRREDRGYHQHEHVCVMITCVLTARHTWIGIQCQWSFALKSTNDRLL